MMQRERPGEKFLENIWAVFTVESSLLSLKRSLYAEMRFSIVDRYLLQYIMVNALFYNFLKKIPASTSFSFFFWFVPDNSFREKQE